MRSIKIRKKKMPEPLGFSSTIIKLLIGLIILLSLVVLLILTNELGLFMYISSINRPPTYYTIEDRCSIIVGNLLHEIKDEGECRIKCNNLCQTEKLKIHSSELIFKNNSCHTCNCYCR